MIEYFLLILGGTGSVILLVGSISQIINEHQKNRILECQALRTHSLLDWAISFGYIKECEGYGLNSEVFWLITSLVINQSDEYIKGFIKCFVSEYTEKLKKENDILKINCKWFAGMENIEMLKCTVNPAGACQNCKHFEL